mmetsp:Transcript_13154/g.16046  ORF Transcript_13154/g.16046 Transcript_13154/m.16046 type:complete len:201 (-) Transcript_13154:175-777(-)
MIGYRRWYPFPGKLTQIQTPNQHLTLPFKQRTLHKHPFHLDPFLRHTDYPKHPSNRTVEDSSPSLLPTPNNNAVTGRSKHMTLSTFLNDTASVPVRKTLQSINCNPIPKVLLAPPSNSSRWPRPTPGSSAPIVNNYSTSSSSSSLIPSYRRATHEQRQSAHCNTLSVLCNRRKIDWSRGETRIWFWFLACTKNSDYSDLR